MIRAALTGNLGMGKSEVLAMFGRLGAQVISSDSIVHELLQRKSVAAGIRRLLGKDVLDRSCRPDRKRIAAVVFSDREKLKSLEAFIHPLVFREVQRRIRALRNGSGIILVEVPLLFEGRFEKQFDRVVTVYAKRDVALKRLKRRGIDAADARRRLRAQFPIGYKKKHSDFVVDNSGARKATLSQVRQVYRQLIEESAERG